MTLLQFQTTLFPYKLCVTEKRIYAKGAFLKFPIFYQFCCQYPFINYLYHRNLVVSFRVHFGDVECKNLEMEISFHKICTQFGPSLV